MLSRGAVSNYDVSYEISGPAVAVPNLIGQAWSAALPIARNAGFGAQIIRTVIGPNTDVPTVTNQIPSSGSLVPRGTTIEVNIVVPPKVRP